MVLFYTPVLDLIV